ncbi:hypothetical protein Nepgr_033729 [Nepenthes gracilis]|uniref:Uncharacterized protein n=1 Tax=Nepenthes gracilis TaxID=150966 RepID=A0AAD3TLP8_NEPGR|nr:hypothetical protein Nepgr_033729 [Nepenthes gracilis]
MLMLRSKSVPGYPLFGHVADVVLDASTVAFMVISSALLNAEEISCSVFIPFVWLFCNASSDEGLLLDLECSAARVNGRFWKDEDELDAVAALLLMQCCLEVSLKILLSLTWTESLDELRLKIDCLSSPVNS